MIEELRALRELNAIRALHVYTVLRETGQMGQTKNRLSEESQKETTGLI